MKYVASSFSAATSTSTASALLTVFAAFGLAQRGGGGGERNTITASALLTVFAVFLGISLVLGMAETNPAAFAQTLSSNFNLGSSNTDATGITELNGKIYVVDSGDTKLFAYNADGTRASGSDVNLGPNNGNPAGITALHGKLLVVDNNDGKIYAYNPNDSRDGSSDFNLNSANGNPNGITALNGNLWIVDNTANKVFVYNPDGTLVSSSEIGLPSDNGDSKGITALHGKLWVVDRADNKVYVYNPDGTQDSSFEFALDSANDSANGITTLNGNLWVVDSAANKVYVYDDVQAPLAFSFRIDEDNSSPSGITHLNGKFWVTDRTYEKVFAYNADGTPDTASDFNLVGGNVDAFGITSYNNKFWVTDRGDDKVYAYNADGTRDATSFDFNLDTANSSPAGITSYNNKFYVVDRNTSTDKVYAYNADGTRAASLDFDLLSANSSPFGITALYDKFYVVDLDGNAYAYNADGTSDADSDFSLKKNGSPQGITSLHGKLWVVDSDDPDTVYPYNPDGTRDLLLNINLDTDNGSPSGITAWNSMLWVVDDVNTKVYAYNRTDGIVGSDSDFELDSNNGSPTGITSTSTSTSLGDKFWVVDETNTKVYAYNAADGTRAATSFDFDLASANNSAFGITALNGKLWVADNVGNKVYAYNADGTQVSGSDFNLATANGSPAGITSFNNKFYVLDRTNLADKVYAYNADGTRAASFDFDLASANTSSYGITALDNRFWVVDDSDDIIYSYDVPTPDIIVPTLSLVSIVSDNVDPSRATTDDTVTLSFTASENIETPTVTINGDTADTVTGSGTSWSATKTIIAADVDGSAVTFTIDFTDFATNAGAQVIGPTDGSSVTVYQPTLDTTAPILTVVSIESNNSNDTTMATLGNTITLSFTSDEDIETPTVTINGVTVSTVTGSNTSWSATKTTTPADADGPVTFTIDFTDLAANDGIAVTSPTAGNSGVTVNKTAPTLIDVSIESNNSDTSRATLGDIITLTFTASEPIGTPDVTINGVTATVAPAVAGSTISWSATKAITAGDNDGAVEFTIDFTDLATNDGIQIISTMDGSSVTVDQTAPTLIDVSIESNNSNDTTRATAGNTVTLSFTSSEPILEPIVTINGDTVTATVLGGDTTTWSAETTIASTDSDGVVAFSISFFDLASNDGGIATSPTTSNPDVTVDNTAPELDTVSIESDNTDTNLATTDDTVTLEFTSSEPIQTPAVTFGGISADTVTGSGNTWSATKIITAADADGSAVTFTISFSDLATNDGTLVTSTTDSSVVTVYQTAPDTTDPELNIVSIESNNSDTSRATLGDIITLTFTASEPIGTPDVTINGDIAAAASGSGNTWSATKTITSGDADGPVTFTINFSDLADPPNDGTQVTSITTGSSVTVDQTAPTLTAVSIESNNSNDTTLATAGNTVTLSFTSSEPILEPTVTINGDTVTATVLGGVTTTWSAETTIASTDSDGVVTFSISFFDLASNDGGIATSPTTSNPDVTVDNTVPELNLIFITSDNSNNTDLATTGDTIILSFTSSEPILQPTVTISGDGASAIVTGSGDSWTATKTVASTDDDGAVTFTIDFTDLATNDGVPVTATGNSFNVTVDNTAPTLTAVSIESDNADPSRATTGDTVTLSFTSLEPIEIPNVTIDGVGASAIGNSNDTIWSATKTITAADVDGSAVTFTIDFTDFATNDGTQVIGPTDGTGVTVYQTAPDTTDPELTAVSIESNNSNDTSRATINDIITLSFTSSEPIETPTVTINGITATVAPAVAGSTTSWSATKAITAGDNDGAVEFTIDFSDLAATPNTGTQVIATKDGTGVTVDKTVPTLTAVSIESNNSNDTTRATAGNTVTLSFTSSEPILQPTVTFGGVTASVTVTGSNISWNAETTIASTDSDGVVAFSISYSDLATNDGGIVTSPTAGNPDVTVDNTVPELTTVSIISNNADTTSATTGNTVTLSFTSSENIETPTVTFGGVAAVAVAGSDNTWSATKTITAADVDGSTVTFAIAFSDLATNAGTTVTSITTGSSVTVYQPTLDTTDPELIAVSIESNNSNDTTLATLGNTVTLSFTSSEPIGTPTVTINGITATVAPAVAGSTISWSATKAITAGDNDGAVEFTIDFSDLADTPNTGTQVIATKDGTGVTVDKIVPTLIDVSIESSNADQFLATAGNVVTLRFTAFEPILQPTVTINGGTVSLAALGNDNITWTATKTITPADPDGPVTFRITFTDLATNDGIAVTSPTAGNPGVTVDNTAPTLTAVSIESNNTNDTTLATTGNTVTLLFESVENILEPTVTINGDPVTTVIGSDTIWSAETTITSGDNDGLVTFTIDYIDLASNGGTQVVSTMGGSSVTVDQMAPTLTAVSIESNNTNDTTLATTGNTVTLSFISSEPILQPTVTINGDSSDDSSNVTLTAIVGDGTTWSATRDITSADSSAPVTFSIAFTDLATNDGSIVTSPTADNPDVTVDNTAPELAPVSIISNNADPSKATTDDTVTLSFTSSENIETPTVTFGGVTATVTGSGTSWSATKTITAADVDGSTVMFAIAFSDLATNAGTTVTSITTGSSVTVYQTAPDTTAPTLTVVSIRSDNSNDTTMATTDNTITLSFTSSEPIGTPTVTINTATATVAPAVAGSTTSWSATKIITAADNDGAVEFTIDYTDLAANDGIQITSTMDGTSVTVDKTAPTLIDVSIESNNSNDTTRATDGNTVTLSFTSSEPILQPTVTFGGVTASVTVTGSNISWNAETTIASTDSEGVVAFSISYSDLAANDGGIVTSPTAGNPDVTVDNTAPELTTVSIVSNNADTTLATTDDTVTLSFTSSENIETPTVTFGGISAVVTGSATSWSAAKIITDTDSDGSAVTFTIDFTDWATNDGTPVTSTTDSSVVTVYQTAPDTTAPTLTAVSIESNNSDTSRATLDDIITLSFTSDEPIGTPTVTINTVTATVAPAVAGSTISWSATKAITAADNDGAVEFTIDFTDLATNDGIQVTSVDDGSSVTVDQTAPELTAVSIVSNNSNDPTRATAGNTVTLSFTSDEPIETPDVTFDGVAASVTVTGSNNSWSAETTIASTDSEGVVTFSISFFDLASNDGGIATSLTAGNSDVTVDNTAPTLTTVSIESDNTDTNLATTDDTVTLEFTSSEPIQTPAVTFGGISADTVTGSGNTWSATKIIIAADVDGSAVTFDISFSDLATNAGTLVTSTTDSSVVTVYQTAPDTTDPELNIVSIESNNSDTSRATLDDIITLSFTSDEDIETPTVTINTVTATVVPAVAGSTISWSATKAITAADNDGAVEFTIDFTDLATNDGIQVTSTMDGSSVTVDQTAPELTAVSIVSNNSNDPTRATAGNTVTLSFTSDEPIGTPTVTFDGVAASVTVTGSNNSWSAETTIASTDSDGVVAFSISYSDLAANDGGIATSLTAGNPDVTVDNTAPTLTTVSIESDNTDTNLATTDDTVTLEFTSSEPIQTPAVTFGGISADTVTGSGNTWSATKIIIAADVDGSAVTFDISFSDLATNAGTLVTSTTDSSVVTVYQTAPDTTDPELNIVSIESNNSDTSRATLDDIITLSFTSDEPIGTPTVTINTVTATVVPAVAGSTISWSATKAITAADNDGAVEFTIDFTDLATNDGIQVTSTMDGSSVTVDQTAPELTAVSIVSNNSNDPTRATAGNTVTLSFTSSEPILEPTVTINGDTVTATVLGGVTTTWSAETTIASTDSDGVVAFSISFFDLASNDGGIATSPTTSNPDVTVDNTAPTLTTVSIESDNADPSRATTGDTVTLSFTSLEPIEIPNVTIDGDVPTTLIGNSNDTIWSATKTITAADVDGSAVTFTIDFTDWATNAGTQVTATDDSSAVTVYQPTLDTTPPILTVVSIESNNSNDTTMATLGNTITLSFTSDEDIETPTVTINTVTATVVPAVAGSTTSWSATKAITAADNDGAVEFTIDFTDLATNDGIQVTSITTGSSVTVDQTAPTLTAVSIESNNTNDTTLATAGNTVTLSFTSSEPILEPTVTISGDGASAIVTGSGVSWSVTKTVASTDSDGAVTFTIDFIDLASNDGTPVTGTIGGTSVTVDQMAPTLTAVSIVSSNSENTSLATTGDTVTLSFTSSEPIGTPTVTIDGVTASAVIGGDNTSWSATKTITAADADGSTVIFTIDFTDLATNDGIPITGPTDSTGVTVYQTAPDTTAPTLTSVSITSNNSNDPSRATTGNTVTLSFTSSEPIGTPDVTIHGGAATVTGSNITWSATKTIASTDDDGAVAFTIDFSDLADTSNVGTQVIATKDGTGVTVDKTVPTLFPVTLESSNADQFLAMKDDTITLRFTASEDIVTPVVTINGVDASATVTGSGDTWSATKIITAADVDGSTVTFTIDFTDLATNVGTTVIDVTADVATITVDQTVPTLNTISITSNNSDDDTLATAGNTVTLSFESSEDIKTPVVTINQVPVTPVAVGDSTAWSATRTITSSDADGIVDFTINYSDLASNAGVEVTGITAGSDVTVDNTAPTLTAVSITSNNSNDITRATTGNTITLSFTSSEPIETPTVTFGGVAASVTVTGSNTSWNAETTIASTDVEGVVAFSISYSDLVANDGSIVTRPTAGNPDVTVDNTAPTLTAVSITSNNSNDTTRATAGNTITLSFTSSEPILQPIVTISGDGASAIVTGSGISWSATKTVASTDDDGVVAFSITYSDLATNDGTPVTSVNDGTSVTVDQTAPTLSLVSIVSNNADPSRATNGNTITLSFTSSEPILEPTVTFGGVAASAVIEGDNTSWSATKIITSADADGSTVTFAIDFTDLAANAGTTVTSVNDGTSVTVDQTAPTLSLVSIVSNNADPSRATNGNTITLSFTSSEPILEPTVTFGGVAAVAVIGGDNTSWSATKTITSADSDGSAVTFAIDFTDLATNDGIPITDPTDSTGVTVYQTAPDTTAPTLTVVSIRSNNSNDSSLATTGNTVTLSFTSSEPIGTPDVTIHGGAATVTGSNITWSATKAITSTDDDGAVEFTIDFSDLAATPNVGTQVIATKDGTDVTVDNTAPTLTAVSIVSDNTDTSRATTDDTITLSFTSSEPIGTPTVTFGGVAASTVTGSGDTWSATKIITAADSDGSTVMFAIAFSDLATNAGTTVTSITTGSSVTVYQTAPDTLAPILTAVSIESNNSDTSRATINDIITLSFTSSESIGTPTVSINGITATVAPAVAGSTTSWSATKAITAADDDGAVEFTIDFSDLAATPNTGTQVIATKDGTGVTVDKTVPTLDIVSIESSNSDTSQAIPGDTVILSFESSETILEPTVTINGDTVTATVLGGDTTTWSAETTITPTDPNGTVTFAISYFDLASNAGISFTDTTDGSSVTVDQTVPTLTAVTIASSNTNQSLATTGDVVTLSFTSSEPIGTPTVTFGGVTATVTGSNTSWSATKTITAADSDGSIVMFAIAFSDLATNAGTTVTSITTGSSVTVYQTAPDTTAPTLTVVSIRSDNSNDTTMATTDNTITLSFTSSEPIGTPTVTINTATATVAPAVAGSTTSWSATKTITSADNDGAVAFTIDFSDLAATPNVGTQVIATKDGTSVTVDTTAPTLSLVSIVSDNTDTSRATTDNTITLSFTSSEPILEPTVTFGGVDASAIVTGSNTSWSATKTITPADSDGSTVTFAIDFTDLATNDGIPITGPTDSTSVTVYQTAPDTTAPTLTAVSIRSDNSNDPSLATTDDTITLSFTSSENIGTPTVTFDGVAASVTVTGSNTSWSATKTITAADSDGSIVMFAIAFSDLATNAGTTVTSITTGSSVTVYQTAPDTTAPTLTAVSIRSDNSNDPSLATTGNTVTLSFTSSEPIGTPTVTFGGVDASTVTGGGDTWSATKTITPADSDGSTVTFAIDFTDLATNDGIPITGPTDGTGVTVYQTAPDTTAPTLTVVSIRSDNSNDSSLATTGDTITLSFTSSEPIGTPTVTINTATATVTPAAPGSTTSWSAETTITSTDDDGVVTFTIAFSDLAATPNAGTPVTDTTDNTGVTVDNTAPTRNSRGSDDDSKTRPTFGISGQTFAQIVNCGYSMDGVCTNVTEYHVDYNRQIIQTGTTHDFALKAYAQNGMKSFVIGFGVNEVGAPASESEASITVNLGRDYTLDSTYTIDSVEYVNDENVIGENATFAVSGVSCNGGGGGSDDDNDDDNDGDSSIIQKDQTQCTQLLIDGVLFREAMYDEPFMIEAVDVKRKAIRHYMNEGLQIIGESINEPPTHKFSSKKTSQSDAVILELTRTDKLKNIWTDQFGYTWSADTPDEWYYVDGPVPDNSSACDSMDHRVCDAFAEKLKYHTSKMESLRDSMYGDIYVAEPFDDLDEVVTFLMTPGESRTQFLDDNAMMWIRN